MIVGAQTFARAAAAPHVDCRSCRATLLGRHNFSNSRLAPSRVPFGRGGTRNSKLASSPIVSALSFWPATKGSRKVEERKAELLEEIQKVNRGVSATAEAQQKLETLIKQLEKSNPTPKPLASDKLNGKWELLYTTSTSVLGTNKPSFLRPSGPIYQYIDAKALKAKNQETWPFFNSVDAEIRPRSDSEVDVQFKLFRVLGVVSIGAPASAKGRLDTTYLDNDLRISRGDKGNVFVLKMADPSATL